VTLFLVDQQLPAALASHLTSQGENAKHIKWYAGGATMKDSAIASRAAAEDRTVVTKDDDFRLLHLARGVPPRLVLVTCGNVSTRDLLALFDRFRADLIAAAASYALVELGREGVYVHDPE